jgi:DnaJ-domain-containing protein 1
VSLRDRLLGKPRHATRDLEASPLRGRTIAELSDEELEAEVIRRRRARARRRDGEERGTRGTTKDSPERKQLLQWYANLELEPGASAEEVRRAYRALMQRYHPDRHRGDPARLEAATKLARSLTEAYEALIVHLEA